MWRFNSEQAGAVRHYVQGAEVLDLGAGDLHGTKALLELGASCVWAVDRNPMPKNTDPRIRTEICYFHNLRESHDVVLASWVVNWAVGLEPVLDEARIVVSLSKNTDGTACGYRQMWEYLQTREVLVYCPDPRNTLTVYGPNRVRRGPTGEEAAALWPDPMHIVSYQEAELSR